MAKAPSSQSDNPEFGVRYETIRDFFSPPLARSTFHDLVNKGQIIPMKGLKGFYLMNESRRRLGFKELREIPKGETRSMEDVVRLAFTLIDDLLFPAPSWLLHVGSICVEDVDYAVALADRYRDQIDSYAEVELKLAYFQGVLDYASVASMQES
jgi:hypothetical protein